MQQLNFDRSLQAGQGRAGLDWLKISANEKPPAARGTDEPSAISTNHNVSNDLSLFIGEKETNPTFPFFS